MLLLNQRIQSQNRAPNDFPQFIREGFDVKVIAPGFKTSPDGIIYKDYTEGTGEMPQDGQVSAGGVCFCWEQQQGKTDFTYDSVASLRNRNLAAVSAMSWLIDCACTSVPPPITCRRWYSNTRATTNPPRPSTAPTARDALLRRSWALGGSSQVRCVTFLL